MNKTKKIDIICYYDNIHQSLFDVFFKPSFDKYLTNNFNLIKYKFYSDPTIISSYNSHHWSQVLINRLDFIKEYIKNNKNKWAIFSDVDIIFFDNFYKNIQTFIETDINNNNNNNIYYMPEHIRALNNEVNGGFFLFYCDNITYELIDQIQKNSRKMDIPNDQLAAREILKQAKNIKQSLLPRHIFLTNNNPRKKIILLLENNTAKVFHATCTTNVMEKIQVLSSVYLKKYGMKGYNIWISQEH